MNYGAEIQTKESIIESFIKNINFNDANLDVNSLKRELSKLLREEPGIKIDWKSEKTVNEVSGKESVIEKMAAIKIIYTATDGEGKLIPKSLTFYGIQG